jgi:hypothetical protein
MGDTRRGWRRYRDRNPSSPHTIVLQTIVTNFAMSTELLVSGMITSKGLRTCRMGVPTNTLPETLYPGSSVPNMLLAILDPSSLLFNRSTTTEWQIFTFGNENKIK